MGVLGGRVATRLTTGWQGRSHVATVSADDDHLVQVQTLAPVGWLSSLKLYD